MPHLLSLFRRHQKPHRRDQGTASGASHSKPVAPAPVDHGPTFAPCAAELPRVLVVDDAELSRLVAGGTLELLGISPSMAESGAQAVRMATAESFDLILMDLQMQGVDGYQATREIRAFDRLNNRPRVAILAYTGTVDASTDWSSHEIDGRLAKPCTPRDVLEACRRWCGTKASLLPDLA